MRTWLLFVTACLASVGAAAQPKADCGEEFDDCMENCRIEHGLDLDRTKAGDCVERCDEKRAYCTDFDRSEQRLDQQNREKLRRPKRKPAPERTEPPPPVDSSAGELSPEASEKRKARGEGGKGEGGEAEAKTATVKKGAQPKADAPKKDEVTRKRPRPRAEDVPPPKPRKTRTDEGFDDLRDN